MTASPEQGQEAGSRQVEVLIVGAGQAGLAMAHALASHGRKLRAGTVVLDAGQRAGHVWRSRWDSLRLFTPTQYASLPGRSLSAVRDVYPTKDEVADYLQAYAVALDLPVHMNTRVTAVEPDVSGGYIVRTDRGVWRARQVVLATGPFQVPVVPPPANGLNPEVVQVHSVDYRRPAQLPDGPVLVVGGGNSGYQIALELAEAGRPVHLSRGRVSASIPQRVLGRDIFWWQSITGLLRLRSDSRLGRRMQQGDGTVIGVRHKDLIDAGVRVHPRVLSTDGDVVHFVDRTSLAVSAVVWATGFAQDHRFVRVPDVLDDQGRLTHHRGVTPAPGLYALGLPWLHTTGSALLGFVSRDADYLAEQIAKHSNSSGELNPAVPTESAKRA